MARIYWRSTWKNPKPRINGKACMPKKPVIWSGEVWFDYEEGGQIARYSREWKPSSPLPRKEAQRVMRAMLDSLLEDHGIGAVAAGFEMVCP